MPTSEHSEPENSRLENIALAIAAVLALVVAAEFALRLAYKDYKNPAAGGLIHRAQIAGTATPESEAPFVTSKSGLLTARPGSEGINADGFRAPDFASLAKEKDLILLLGDAPVFGIAADPMTKSFADLLSASGKKVVNLGIPGAGVRQYAALAERYVPLLKPSTVLVLFNTGDDFEIDPPVQTGTKRYYAVGDHVIPASDGAGQPYTPEEAIRAANATADAPGAVATLLRKTVLGSMLLDTLGVQNDARRVPDVLDALDAIQEITENNAAIFQLILTPLPEGNAKEALARAEATLDKFSPISPGAYATDDFSDVDNAVLNNSGHEHLADFISQRLATLTGALPINPAFANNDAPLTLDEFCNLIGLEGEERQKGIDFLNTLKEETARTLFEPALEAPSPGEFAVGYAIANPGGKDFGTAFMDYTSRHIHAATGLYYIDLLGETIQQQCADFTDTLPESQRPNFAQVQQRDLGNISTGNDPLSNKITEAFDALKANRATLEASTTGGEMQWEEFVAFLQLSPEQASTAKTLFDTLKQEFTEILSRPGKDGAPSPVAQVAVKLRAQAPNEEIAAVMSQATKGIEAESGKPYLELYTAREAELLGKLFKVLSPKQVGLYPRLPVSALLKIKTDTDPFNNAIARAAAGQPGDEDKADPNSWTIFRADLKLDEDQASNVLKIINDLKDRIVDALKLTPTEGKSAMETMREAKAGGIDTALAKMLERAQSAIDPASGKTISKLMEEAEIEAHKAIYRMLTPQQIPDYEKAASRSLASIRTGHEPLDEAMTAP